MENAEIERIIREYIDQVVHMSLGTCADGRPWVCEVHFAVDDELNIYFRSRPESRHSQEIAANPNVAGSIITQHFKNQKPRGVYFEGIAEVLNDITEDYPGVQATAQRFGEKEALAPLAHDSAKRYYKITVKNWYVFDTYGPAPVGKYQLPWKQ